MTQWWAEPTAGDIVWCHFPDDIHPRPKPRPALILVVFDLHPSLVRALEAAYRGSAK